ncbi:MAG: hypothetical protein IJ728_01505 [Selenomonadaceae bacterium]|nr:hypothetical protein [Selenomonadaceae bacterium]
MTSFEIDSKVKELRELRRMAEDLAGMIDTIQDAIKAEMTAQNTDILTGADWKITWKEVKSSRIDTKRLEADLGDLSEYKNVSIYKRF